MNAYDKGTYEERVRREFYRRLLKMRTESHPVIAWLFLSGISYKFTEFIGMVRREHALF